MWRIRWNKPARVGTNESWRASSCHTQGAANTACAFTAGNQRDALLLAASAETAEQWTGNTVINEILRQNMKRKHEEET